MAKRGEISPRTLVNSIHLFKINGKRSTELYNETINIFLSKEEKFNVSDRIRLFWEILSFELGIKADYEYSFEEEITIEDINPQIPEEKQKIIEKILPKIVSEAEMMNLLDLKQLYKSMMLYLRHLVERDYDPKELVANSVISSVFHACFAVYEIFQEDLDIADAEVFLFGLEYLVLVDSEESRRFLADVKFRLKLSLKRYRPQAQIERISEEVKLVEDEKIKKVFDRILG